MSEEEQVDELIEKMKTKSFKGSYQVRCLIQTIEEKPDFYRKSDLIKVLFERYNNLLSKDFDEILNKVGLSQ